MKVLIGVDPHKGSVAVAAVDEATGELLGSASFPQVRAGLGALGHRRGDWQRQASPWWTSLPSFRQGCGCSPASLATPETTTGSMP